MIIKPHKTAIFREKPSLPLRDFVTANGGFHDLGRILDYGCGRGQDVKWLISQGCNASGYDPYQPFGHSDMPKGKFDTVLMTYVINVLPPKERKRAILDAWNRVGPSGVFLIAARSAADVKKALSPAWRRHMDGFISPSNTFQKGIKPIELDRIAKKIDPLDYKVFSVHGYVLLLCLKRERAY